jgi:hypothetical protein
MTETSCRDRAGTPCAAVDASIPTRDALLASAQGVTSPLASSRAGQKPNARVNLRAALIEDFPRWSLDVSCFRNAAPLFLSLALYVRAILGVRRGNANEAIAVIRGSLFTHSRTP